MKRMTCKQLGGACNEEFVANTFEEMAELSKNHGMKMIKDPAHAKAMSEMVELMKKPQAMKEWFEQKLKEFNSLQEE